MRAWHRVAAVSVVSSTVLALACGGQTAGGGGAGGGSGGCDGLFDVLVKCTLPSSYPADELSRLRGRWSTLCSSLVALPGEGVTTGAIDACIGDVNANGCGAINSPSGACQFTSGSLPGGSTCESDSQCQSGTCDLTGGDAGFTICGSCFPQSGIGQACQGRSCGAGAACVYTGGNGSTCVAVTVSGAGGACDGEGKQCEAGLVCNTASHVCASPGAAGAPCAFDVDCASGLVCPPSSTGGAARCASPGQAGARCGLDSQCSTGLGCDANAGTCAQVTYVGAGQPCTGTTRCLVGTCPVIVSPGGGTGSGTCPPVVADGQPCNDATGTCDTFANCNHGVCTLGYAGACH
jgi:hypothetical protein